MTEVEKSVPIEEVGANQTSTIDDEAYLMTLVENDDSLLPSNMTFTGLFEGDHELNADELSDIALLLAPQVSDDDTGGSVSSSETSATPVNFQDEAIVAAAATVAACGSGEVPILPKFQKEAPSAAVVVSPTGSQKRRFVSHEPVTPEASPLKKAKLTSPSSKSEGSIKLVLKPKPAPSLPELPQSSEASKSLSAADDKKTDLPTLAPKPSTSAVLKKLTASTATAADTTSTKPAPASPKAPVKKTSTSKTTAAAAPTKAASTAAKAAATEEERAQQCRDRNRQHARNTRLRKKAYVEELKKQLVDMVEERDAKLLEEAQQAKIVEQQREVRFQVMQDFLQLRGRNEGNPQRWGAILEEGFTLTLPKTTFQTMVASSKEDTATLMQVLDGVPDIMADSTYFASFLQTLGNQATHTHSTTGDDTYIPVTTIFVYLCDRSNFLMDGSNAILNWTAHSSGAVQSGARRELELSGSMRARFCPQTNRMEKAEIQFDTGLVHSQLFV